MPFLFFRWGDENSERESHFPEVTQPVSNRGRAPIPPILLSGLHTPWFSWLEKMLLMGETSRAWKDSGKGEWMPPHC